MPHISASSGFQTAAGASADPAGDEDQLTRELLADLRRLQEGPGGKCAACAAALCGHEILMSLVIGCKDQPRCLDCLAQQVGHGREEVRDHIFSYIRLRPCRMAGWEWASQAEKFAATALPACMWPSQPADTVAGTTAEDVAPKEVSAMTELNSNEPQADSEWDAGALGCGELVMGLRQRLLAMEPGRILKLTATDAGMPADLPAWCGMTGHTLVLSKHPEYWIRRKGN